MPAVLHISVAVGTFRRKRVTLATAVIVRAPACLATINYRHKTGWTWHAIKRRQALEGQMACRRGVAKKIRRQKRAPKVEGHVRVIFTRRKNATRGYITGYALSHVRPIAGTRPQATFRGLQATSKRHVATRVSFP